IEYRIRGHNARGDANARPIVHTLSVLADMAPEISLMGPESRVLRVRPDSRLNLEIRASDPDYGLTEIRLDIGRGTQPLRSVHVLESDGATGRQVKYSILDLAQWKAEVGERFLLSAVAKDNRHDPVSQQP